MHWKKNEVLLYELYNCICVCGCCISESLDIILSIERQTSFIFLICIKLFFLQNLKIEKLTIQTL